MEIKTMEFDELSHTIQKVIMRREVHPTLVQPHNGGFAIRTAYNKEQQTELLRKGWSLVVDIPLMSEWRERELERRSATADLRHGRWAIKRNAAHYVLFRVDAAAAEIRIVPEDLPVVTALLMEAEHARIESSRGKDA